MRSFKFSILAITLLASIALADTTWVAENIPGGVWSIEGNPYIINNEAATLDAGAILIIEPGVQILLDRYTYFILRDGTLDASNLAAGVYVVVLRGEGFVKREKLVAVK